jgi:type IV secretion/conjugal transfer VirB4 family ATPase
MATEKFSTISNVEDAVPTYAVEDFVALEGVWEDGYTLYTREGALCQVVELTGIDFIGLSSDVREKYRLEREAFFREIPTGMLMRVVYTRRKLSASNLDADCGNPHVNQVVTAHMQNFEDAYVTNVYLVLQVQGRSILSRAGIPSRGWIKERLHFQRQVEALTDKVQTICSFLEEYRPTRIALQSEEQMTLCGFFGYLLHGGVHYTTPERTDLLNKIIPATDIEICPKRKTVTFYDGEKTRHLAAITLNSLPEATHDHILDGLYSLPYEFSVIHTIWPQTVEANQAQFSKMIAFLQGFARFGHARLDEVMAAATSVDARELQFHGHSCTVYVYATSTSELSERVRSIQAYLLQAGISAIREGYGLYAAFWGQLPGAEAYLAARKTLISSGNLSDLITFQGADGGHDRCAYGPMPVTVMRRLDGSNYLFTFHSSSSPDAAGHTMIIGGTGSGKTTLAMFLIVQCLKYSGQGDRPLRVLLFDSGKGTKIPTRAFGGSYDTIRGDEQSVQMNPLVALTDNPTNREFLADWLGMLAGGVNEQEKKILAEVVRQNYALAPHERRLHNIRDFLGVGGVDASTGRLSLLGRLQKWLPAADDPLIFDSPFARYFNGDSDTLSFDKRIVAFDMAAALGGDADKRNELLAPLTSYIFRAFNNLLTNSPFPHLIFVDEAVQYLNDPIFGPYILKIMREQRKKGGLLCMAAQEARVLTATENGRNALENMETFIIYPNASAEEKHYMADGLALNDREFSWVKNPSFGREVMVKRRNGGSVILNVDLGHLGSLLSLFNSRASEVERAEKLMSLQGDAWIQSFLQGDRI